LKWEEERFPPLPIPTLERSEYGSRLRVDIVSIIGVGWMVRGARWRASGGTAEATTTPSPRYPLLSGVRRDDLRPVAETTSGPIADLRRSAGPVRPSPTPGTVTAA
jgi:hypothetical protein